MQGVRRSPNSSLNRRMEAAFVVFGLVFVALIGRLAWIQWWQQGRFRGMANRFHARTIPSPSSRGAILARDGQELASNLLARDLCANPRVISDPTATAKTLAELFGGRPEEYQAKVESARQSAFVYLRRGLDREFADSRAAALRKRAELEGI